MGDDLLKGFAVEVLHDHVGAFLILSDIEDADDVGGAEGGEGAAFAEDGLVGFLDILLVGHEALDGHGPVELAVPGEIHGAAAALTELALDVVAFLVLLHAGPLGYCSWGKVQGSSAGGGGFGGEAHCAK